MEEEDESVGVRKDKELKLEDEDWYESAEEDWYERRDTECVAVSRSVVTSEKENTIKTETPTMDTFTTSGQKNS